MEFILGAEKPASSSCYFFPRQPCSAGLGDRSDGVTGSTEQGPLAGWATLPSVQERVCIRLTCRALQPWATLGLQEPGGWLRRSQRPQKPCEKGVNESLDFSGWLRWLLLIFFEFRCVISVHTLGITGRWVHIFLIEPDGRQHCDKIWGKMWLCKKVLVSACDMCPHVPWDLKGTCQRVLSWEETQGDRHECFVSVCTGRSGLLFPRLGHQKSLLICPTVISWSGKSTCFLTSGFHNNQNNGWSNVCVIEAHFISSGLSFLIFNKDITMDLSWVGLNRLTSQGLRAVPGI